MYAAPTFRIPSNPKPFRGAARNAFADNGRTASLVWETKPGPDRRYAGERCQGSDLIIFVLSLPYKLKKNYVVERYFLGLVMVIVLPQQLKFQTRGAFEIFQ